MRRSSVLSNPLGLYSLFLVSYIWKWQKLTQHHQDLKVTTNFLPKPHWLLWLHLWYPTANAINQSFFLLSNWHFWRVSWIICPWSVFYLLHVRQDSHLSGAPRGVPLCVKTPTLARKSGNRKSWLNTTRIWKWRQIFFQSLVGICNFFSCIRLPMPQFFFFYSPFDVFDE